MNCGTRPTRGDAKHLLWLREQFGDRFVAGFVVHTDGDSFTRADDIRAVPIYDVCGTAP